MFCKTLLLKISTNLRNKHEMVTLAISLQISFSYFGLIRFSRYRPVSSVEKHIRAGGLGFNSEPIKSAQCRQRLAKSAATFLRRCVSQALSGEDGPRHSLHVST